MSAVNKFDIIAIGGGPAAQKCTIQAAQLGKKAAIIEKDSHLGGGCVHWGTIPSKSLQETSRFFRQLQSVSVHGLEASIKEKLTWEELNYRATKTIESEEDVAREQMIQNRVTILTGWGKMIDPHHVEVTSPDGRKKTYESDYILIATGSSPRRPSDEGIPYEDGIIFDSNGLFSVRNVPSSIAIVGSGIIGSEYATIFAHIGIQVHLFDTADRVLGFLDKDISSTLELAMKSSNIQLHLGCKITNYSISPSRDYVDITTDKGESIRVDQVLISKGRVGNVKGIGLEELGIEVNSRGQIVVNENYQTNHPNIYAAGDVIGFPALASASMYQGHYVSKHIFSPNKPTPVDIESLPIGVYTLPEISTIGPTEEALQLRGVDYGVGTATFETITRSQISGDTQGILKLIYEKATNKLLAVHIVSDKATELIALGQSVVNLGGKIDYFTEHIFNYPTLIGAYKNAALNAIKNR